MYQSLKNSPEAIMRFLLTLFLALSSLVYAGKGKTYPSEWKILPALIQDFEVVKLTSNKATDSKLYLNVNPYIPKKNSILFMSERDGYDNLYLLSLKDGKIVQITASKKMDGGHVGVSAVREKAFFREDDVVKSVDLNPPYAEENVYEVKEDNFRISGQISVSPDGYGLTFALYDEDKKISQVVTVDVNEHSAKKVRKEKGRVDHVIFNPIHGDKLLYHVYEKNTVGVVDLNTAQTTVISANVHAVHSFWFSDGITAAYVLKDLDGPVSEQIVGYNTSTKQYIKYDLPYYGNHFAMNPAGTILQGDGNPSDPYITYFYIDHNTQKLNPVKMFKHNSSSTNEDWHPHGVFINDTDLLFNSDAAGNGDVYLLRKKS